MTSIGSPSPFFLAGKKAYAVDRSLRFNDGDSPNLNRQYAQEPTSQYKMTFSCWVKRCSSDSGIQTVIGVQDNWETPISFSNDSLRVVGPNQSATYITTAKYRDFSAWMHVMTVYDTQNSTGADRMICYINGERLTDFSTSGTVTLNQTVVRALRSGYNTYIGRDGVGNYADMYIAEVNVIDGQAYDPSYFTETDSTTGQLIPKKYTGSYGTNGFYLNFSDNSGTTATTLGKDSSGNSNNFTPNNFSVATGVDNDSVVDTPTNNFSILNPLDKAAAITTQNGNLQIAGSSTGNYNGIRASFGAKTGKYYWEIKFPNTGYITTIGIARADAGRIDNGNQPTYRIVLGLGSWFTTYNSNNVDTFVNANINYGNWSGASNYSTNDVYMIAVDFSAGKIWWGKNGSWFNNSGTANPATGTDPRITFTTGNEWFPYSQEASSTSCNPSYNFGQQGFVYTPPTNFVALSSANLPDSTILLPNKHFGIITYTGDGTSSHSITNSAKVDFTPDWVWIKRRSASANHRTLDSVRGSTKELYPNLTNAEQTFTGISSFDSNGFTLATADGSYNLNSATYVAWNWNAGDTDGKTYTVKVHNFSGNNRYIFDDFQTQAVTLDLAEGGTYIFNMDDSSNASHPFMIGTTANDNTTAFGSGIVYKLDGVVKTFAQYHAGFSAATTRRLEFTIPASTNNLFYFCYVHSGMGGQINTNSTLGSSNFDGTIQTTVKANATAGFSIVTWTGNQTSGATLGHGLGVAPKVVFVKRRDGSSNWISPFFDLQTAGKLNATDAFTSNYYNVFFTSQPSSTLLTIGNNDDINRNTSTYVAYVFSEVAGYSKFGSYSGNGSSDGPFVFTGFTPKWILLKCAGSTGNWVSIDTERPSGGNLGDYNTLSPNLASAENSSGGTTNDILSNGFKLRGTNDRNINGQQHIYLAFAESPFKNARAR